jgi:hypothetical protein
VDGIVDVSSERRRRKDDAQKILRRGLVMKVMKCKYINFEEIPGKILIFFVFVILN